MILLALLACNHAPADTATYTADTADADTDTAIVEGILDSGYECTEDGVAYHVTTSGSIASVLVEADLVSEWDPAKPSEATWEEVHALTEAEPGGWAVELTYDGQPSSAGVGDTLYTCGAMGSGVAVRVSAMDKAGSEVGCAVWGHQAAEYWEWKGRGCGY